MQRNENIEREWNKLLEECIKRTDQRIEKLESEGIKLHMDGENHFKDIDEWFKKEAKSIKSKYNS